MAVVTKEIMQSLFDNGVFPPRHQQGCPKNYARMLPMVFAAKGLSVEEIKVRVSAVYKTAPCECR